MGCWTWTVDAEAARGADRALLRLERELRRIEQRTAARAVTRLYMVTASQVRLTEVMARPEECPPLESETAVLRRRPRSSRGEEGSQDSLTAADGRPCIYGTMDFVVFARAWIAWRKRHRKPCSARFLAKLSFLPHFRANPAWISLALRGRLPVKDARDLLRALVQAGLLAADLTGALHPMGEDVRIPIPDGLDLCDPLPLPEGLFAELQIDLDGPLSLTTDGQIQRSLDLDTLTAILEDPDAAAEAGVVRIDLSEGGWPDGAALADGLVAR